jgi:hypothetical protein
MNYEFYFIFLKEIIKQKFKEGRNQNGKHLISQQHHAGVE